MRDRKRKMVDGFVDMHLAKFKASGTELLFTRIARSDRTRCTPGGAELQQLLVGAAEGADQVLVQRGEEFQGGVGAGGEEGFARLALQLEDDPIVGHRTRRGARLAADEADLTEDAAAGSWARSCWRLRTRTVTSTLPLTMMKQLPPGPPSLTTTVPCGRSQRRMSRSNCRSSRSLKSAEEGESSVGRDAGSLVIVTRKLRGHPWCTGAWSKRRLGRCSVVMMVARDDARVR